MCRCTVLCSSSRAGMWMELNSVAAALLGCAVLCREPCSGAVSLGLKPYNHLGHRGKECTDLMMHRKSAKPHSSPGAAIGQHCASLRPAHQDPPQSLWTHSIRIHSQCVCMHGGLFCTAMLFGCSSSSVTTAEVEEVSARQDTEQEG